VIERENIKKGENMSFIDLDSVGSTVTSEGLVFPIDISEAPTTASEADEMMGVHIMDCVDEWWEGMSMEDMTTLFPFLAETDLYDIEGYLIWALAKGELVEEANEISLGEYMSEVI